MIVAVDAADPPNLPSVKASGAVAVSRYVKKVLPNSFDLGSQERLNILGAGLGLLYNPEQSANDVLVQSTAYFVDYAKYVSDRLQAFGVDPAGVNLPVSSDCQVTAAALPKVMNNMAAFAANCAPFGMVGYGQISVLNLLTVEGISPKGAKHWLTGSIGWSGLPNTRAGWAEYMQFPYAGMVQLGPQAVGFYSAPTVPGCDTNVLLDPAAVGFEWPQSSPYHPKPPAPKEHDMVIVEVDTTGDGQPDGFYLLDGPGRYENILAGQLPILQSVIPTATGVVSLAQHQAWLVSAQITVTIPPVEVNIPPIPAPVVNFPTPPVYTATFTPSNGAGS